VLLGTPQGWRGEGVIARFWEIVAQHRVNFFSGVPTVYAALLQQPVDGHDLRSLEYGLCGAAPMPQELIRSVQARCGLKILEGYGLTEGTCVSTVNPPRGESRPGSIGLRVPLQEMKAVLLDEAGRHLRDCGPGEVGLLLIRGPNVFRGYKVAAHNEGLWIQAGEGPPWLNTGDLGRCDADGYFYLTGRKKELIIRGGHNIDPAVIEEPLHQHPAVQLAAAIGRPDAHAGEVPVAYVQLRPGAQAQAAELLDFVRERIGERAAVPKAVRIVAEMPLTGVGKIFKPELKLRETERAAGGAAGRWRGRGGVLARQDPARGICVAVSLAPGADAVTARTVLGRFPHHRHRPAMKKGTPLAFPSWAGAWPPRATALSAGSGRSGLLGPGAAPALASHGLATEQAAGAGGIARLALEQGAAMAHLAGLVLRILLAIGLGGVGHIAQADGLRVLLVELGLGHGAGGRQASADGGNGHHEDAAIGGHENSVKEGQAFRTLANPPVERVRQHDAVGATLGWLRPVRHEHMTFESDPTSCERL
jgi:hypothetical protein